MCVFASRLPQRYSTSLISNGLPKNHLNVNVMVSTILFLLPLLLQIVHDTTGQHVSNDHLVMFVVAVCKCPSCRYLLRLTAILRPGNSARNPSHVDPATSVSRFVNNPCCIFDVDTRYSIGIFLPTFRVQNC